MSQQAIIELGHTICYSLSIGGSHLSTATQRNARLYVVELYDRVRGRERARIAREARMATLCPSPHPQASPRSERRTRVSQLAYRSPSCSSSPQPRCLGTLPMGLLHQTDCIAHCSFWFVPKLDQLAEVQMAHPLQLLQCSTLCVHMCLVRTGAWLQTSHNGKVFAKLVLHIFDSSSRLTARLVQGWCSQPVLPAIS